MSNIQITAILEQAVPIKSDIRNAFIDFSQMTASVVAIVTNVQRHGRPVIGYGFNSNGRYAPSGLLRERFMPRLLNAEPRALLNDEGTNLDPQRAWALMMTGEKPGGHGERSVAVGVLDMALWDAVAKIEEKPLYRVLAERFNGGKVDEEVWVYAAGGYYQPDKDLSALQDEMRGFLDIGYTTVKIKIGGATLDEDLRRIEAVIDVTGSGSNLAVDANGRFDQDTAIQYAKAMQPYGLHWYEEAGDPLDYALQAELANHYGPPMATGENLFSMQDARNLVRYAGMRPDRDILQFDPALSYGLVEYLPMIQTMEEHGWSRRQCVPHGGHQMALNIAAGLGLGGNESYPGVFQPFGGFADGIKVNDGRVRLPDSPGVGFEEKSNLITVMRSVAE
ncbi:mandelate racemase/muconate lactonizing enzyme family protein [soil metagenome]